MITTESTMSQMRRHHPSAVQAFIDNRRREIVARAVAILRVYDRPMLAKKLAEALGVSPHAIDHYLRGAAGLRKEHRRPAPGEHSETWYVLDVAADGRADGLAGASGPTPAA